MKKTDKFPIATKADINFGFGQVEIKTNGEIAAMEIDYAGVMKGTKKLGKGWNIKIGRNKIIIFSLLKSPLTEVLFTYTGQLRIMSCKVVNWQKKLFYAKINNLNLHTWNQLSDSFNNKNDKVEEIKELDVIGKKELKSSI
tara:strand:+ start:1416 stop:1838 length:423 start_codon:yes stop_codon:yes gene_type:complete